ncbi:cation:proton antiporter [Chthonobacter rhizosphaerae]|uniref:cation:proton antiporter n=1 Tax=Chthonobacter rhizosphaerae TaxID=2735553 RepID=UPI0015EFD5E9|nr:cation:proton antiporter [Chthonobacter rhizosphaerae]
MDSYIVVLTGFGVIVLLTAWLPMVLRELPLSLPICCIALGAAVFSLPALPGIAPDPLDHLALTERLTEFVVIVALMGAGLKLDRPLAWSSSALTWRLLVIAMPLTIAAIAVLGVGMLGLGTAAAILLGAALAPTDPVLASDVQVGAPGEGKEDEVRYALTSEAGLNDGLAFPFVHLAIALVALKDGWFVDWVSYSVIWKLAAGVAIGWVVGRVLGWVTFRLPNRARLSRTGDGFVALGITAIAYGLTEMASGYGFLAVFVAAISFRSVERNHDYHDRLHDFIEQLERLLMMALLVIFGGALAAGNLLSEISWPVIGFAVLVLFVVRPVIGWISLIGSPQSAGEKGIISFFGIRGLGTAYYLAYACNHENFGQTELLWTAASVIVLFSIVLHGVTVTPVMRRLDHHLATKPEPDGPDAPEPALLHDDGARPA